MKKKYITFAVIIVFIVGLFFGVYRFSKRPVNETTEKPKAPVVVSVQNASASTSLTQEIQYPATVVGDQEVKVTAKASGNAQAVNYDLGDRVAANATLVKIDDNGNNLDIGDEGFRSAQVQQAQLAVDQAEEQLKTAEKTYRKLNSAYQTQKKNSSLTKTVSKAQLIAAKGQEELAEIQLESARVGLAGGLDNHLITSPISGYVTSKSITTGDSVTLGQQLYTISKTDKMKVQFYIDEEQLAAVREGMETKVVLNGGETIAATVENIAPSADETTKRFLVEARPTELSFGQAFPVEQDTQKLISGTIVSVSFSYTQKPQNPGDLILPLGAITIGQNENYIFLNDNGKAKKVTVEVVKVSGESAEIKANIPANAAIIINGSKLVGEGDQVDVQK